PGGDASPYQDPSSLLASVALDRTPPPRHRAAPGYQALDARDGATVDGALRVRAPPFGRAWSEGARAAVERAELTSVVEGLLEVVTDDLVELHEVGRMPLEPIGKAFVQFGPCRLRQRLIGGIPDKEVAETKRVITGEQRLLW